MRILETVALAAVVGLGGVSLADHAATSSQGASELARVMQKGAQEMQAMKSSGDVDHDFVMGMKKHHEDALAMSKVMLKYGKDAEAREFAQKIIDSQRKEIEEFDRWMSRHPEMGHMPPSHDTTK